MFANMIRGDSRFVEEAIELILTKINSKDISESVRSLEILEECMSRSGADFQSEISKYRFLNQLSKLVSIKHDGNTTAKEIKDKIMDCFLLWTAQYPEKEKIKAVYDGLKKEGIQDTNSSSNVTINCTYQRKTNLMDKEDEKKFRRLLQSTNKEDIKKANLLIQHYVKQDGKKAERVLKQKAELECIQNAVQIFNEVYENYIQEKSGNEETLTLLEELYETCTKKGHIVRKMPDIMEDSEEDLIRETMRVNDMLLEVENKYKMMSSGNGKQITEEIRNVVPKEENNFLSDHLEDLLSVPLDQPKLLETSSNKENPLDELADIFPQSLPSNCLTPAPVPKVENNEDSTLLDLNTKSVSQKPIFSTIDDLSIDLINKELSNLPRAKTFRKENSKISLNQLSKEKQNIISEVTALSKEKASIEKVDEVCSQENKNVNPLPVNEMSSLEKRNGSDRNNEVKETDLKINPKDNLYDIEINFDEIKPSNVEQIILFDCNNGLRITLNFAANKPREYTSVIVVSSTNQGQSPVDDFQFDACVDDSQFEHEPCKLRLLQRNGSFLPGVKPFCPPSDCLHQIMLIYNPTENPLKVRFTYSYKQGDDPITGSLIRSIPYLK
ncbi:ADP-ribosylation factor-binding protein GGA1 isoform X2 [Condylostylus longicornis]|nr:ADP-ribosylation factor-binding protein GGA1 isoform X2 [Condylostylus longicornis]